MLSFFGEEKFREFYGSLNDFELAQQVCDYEELCNTAILQNDSLSFDLKRMLEIMKEIAVARFIVHAFDEGLEKEIEEGIF